MTAKGESIGAIVVHLGNDPDNLHRLHTAVAIAGRRKAHLIGLFFINPVGGPAEIAGRGASQVMLSEARRAAEEAAQKLEKVFTESCDSVAIDHRWVVTDGDHLERMAEHAHLADLMIVSQPRGEYLEDRFRVRLPEQLVLRAGLPVLMLPRDAEIARIAKRVLIAWRNSRETVRAVRDALPALHLAEQVTILTVNPTEDEIKSKHEVIDYLARHGITAKADRLTNAGKVGPALIDYATREGYELIVLGAYSHSPTREILLGGTTRYIMENTTVPILMSH